MVLIQSKPNINSLLQSVRSTGILPKPDGDTRMRKIKAETIQLQSANLLSTLTEIQKSSSSHISLNGIVFSKKRAANYIQKMMGQ